MRLGLQGFLRLALKCLQGKYHELVMLVWHGLASLKDVRSSLCSICLSYTSVGRVFAAWELGHALEGG